MRVVSAFLLVICLVVGVSSAHIVRAQTFIGSGSSGASGTNTTDPTRTSDPNQNQTTQTSAGSVTGSTGGTQTTSSPPPPPPSDSGDSYDPNRDIRTQDTTSTNSSGSFDGQTQTTVSSQAQTTSVSGTTVTSNQNTQYTQTTNSDPNATTSTVAPYSSSPRTLAAPSDSQTNTTAASPIITPEDTSGNIIRTIANDTAERNSANQLEAIGTDLRRTQQYVENIKTSATEIFNAGIRSAIPLQPRQTPDASGSSSGQISITKAEEASQEVIQTRLRVSAILENAAKNSPPQIGQTVDSLVTSSIAEIQEAIKQETGADVQFSARNMRDVTAENAAAIQRSTESLQARDGLDMYLDTDSDGVSDYDETHIYKTDPRNQYTANGYLSDGERILLGLDPHSTSTQVVPVDPPSPQDQISKTLFQVTVIKTVSTEPLAPVATSTESQLTETPVQPKALTFEGTGLPNSFVTLYIFSSPIVVTVKTDINGNWKYTLDTELPDGSHELYVAMVNNDGRVIARSPVVPFIKQAEAVSYVPLVTPPVSDPSFIETLWENMFVVAGVLFLMFAGAAVVIAGFMRRPDSSPPPAATPTPPVTPAA